MTLVRYDAACAALAAAVQADEVMSVHLEARAIEAVARVARNFDLEVSAVKLRTRAEARLGEMMIEAQEKGLLAKRGGQPKAKDEGSASEPSIRATLREIGVDKKLSAQAKRLGGIGQKAVEAMLTRFEAESISRGRPAFDVIHNETAKRNAESRRQLAQELSDCSALSPHGRKFPIGYADPAWMRKAGIGNRAYENHYDTMSWDEIIAMGPAVKARMLPDSWFFIWVPRAHMLALHPVQVMTGLGIVTIKMPLIWAVAQAFGCDDYSTCFVWTKTDEENPDDHGLGLIVWDQDEILCMFKRGNGLPKPDTDKKFGSNHREPTGKHSAKPTFYRDMINAMTGGLPVLELFAREDDDHVLPPNFYTWGNQSRNTANEPVARETPVDSAGATIAHDPDTGEAAPDADDQLDIPPFLARKAVA